MSERDARTTPPWLRAPAVGLIGLTALWFALSYGFALGGAQPAWARPWPWVWWFANWEMFTLLDDHASRVGAEAMYDGEWHNIHLEELFPSRWESGPRYDRPAFYNRKDYMAVLGDSTCGRLERKTDRLRFYRVTWKKTPGVATRREPKGTNRRYFFDWTCGQPAPRPQGVRL